VRLLALAAVVAMLGACGADGGDGGGAAPPDRAADSVGPVSAVSERSVRIEEATGVVGAVEARLDGDTEVLRRRGDEYEAAAVADIEVGDRVEVWVDGPVAESFPVQAHAAVVVLAG